MDADYRVNTLELRDALKTLSKVGKDKKNYTGEAVIDFLVDKIEVNFNGMTTEIAAKGVGQGRARVSSGFVTYRASVTKDQKDTKIWVEDSSFHIDIFTLPCDWNDISPKIIELPINPSLAKVLLLRSKYTRDEIVASGLESILNKAEEDLGDIIEQATKILQPFHISGERLNDFIYETMMDEPMQRFCSENIIAKTTKILQPLNISGEKLNAFIYETVMNEPMQRFRDALAQQPMKRVLIPLWKKLNGASFGSDDRPPGAPNTKRALIAVLIDDWPESKIRDALRDDFGIKIQ